MNSFLRFVILLVAVTVALAPLIVVAQTQTPAKFWTPPKTPWGDPDIQGLWPGVDMVGTPLERDRSFGTRAFLTEEEFAKKVAFAEEQNEIDTAETVSRNPRIARGGNFITCEQDPNLCRNGVRIGPPNYWDERGKPNKQASLVMRRSDPLAAHPDHDLFVSLLRDAPKNYFFGNAAIN